MHTSLCNKARQYEQHHLEWGSREMAMFTSLLDEPLRNIIKFFLCNLVCDGRRSGNGCWLVVSHRSCNFLQNPHKKLKRPWMQKMRLVGKLGRGDGHGGQSDRSWERGVLMNIDIHAYIGYAWAWRHMVAWA